MTFKTWNIRDAPEEELRSRIERTYKEIEKNYKLLKKVSEIEDAQRMVNQIWKMKAWANDMQLELIRREYENGTTS